VPKTIFFAPVKENILFMFCEPPLVLKLSAASRGESSILKE
jgi:hypothetical protein